MCLFNYSLLQIISKETKEKDGKRQKCVVDVFIDVLKMSFLLQTGAGESGGGECFGAETAELMRRSSSTQKWEIPTSQWEKIFKIGSRRSYWETGSN